MAVDAHPMPSRDHRKAETSANERSFLPRTGVPRPGSIYAIIGPDGAGKTTIALDMVTRLLRRGIRTRTSRMRPPRTVSLAVRGLPRHAPLGKPGRLGGRADVRRAL